MSLVDSNQSVLASAEFPLSAEKPKLKLSDRDKRTCSCRSNAFHNLKIAFAVAAGLAGVTTIVVGVVTGAALFASNFALCFFAISLQMSLLVKNCNDNARRFEEQQKNLVEMKLRFPVMQVELEEIKTTAANAQTFQEVHDINRAVVKFIDERCFDEKLLPMFKSTFNFTLIERQKETFQQLAKTALQSKEKFAAVGNEYELDYEILTLKSNIERLQKNLTQILEMEESHLQNNKF